MAIVIDGDQKYSDASDKWKFCHDRIILTTPPIYGDVLRTNIINELVEKDTSAECFTEIENLNLNTLLVIMERDFTRTIIGVVVNYHMILDSLSEIVIIEDLGSGASKEFRFQEMKYEAGRFFTFAVSVTELSTFGIPLSYDVVDLPVSQVDSDAMVQEFLLPQTTPVHIISEKIVNLIGVQMGVGLIFDYSLDPAHIDYRKFIEDATIS